MVESCGDLSPLRSYMLLFYCDSSIPAEIESSPVSCIVAEATNAACGADFTAWLSSVEGSSILYVFAGDIKLEIFNLFLISICFGCVSGCVVHQFF